MLQVYTGVTHFALVLQKSCTPFSANQNGVIFSSILLELKFRTAGEGEFDNAEQPYQGKFLLLSGTSTTLGFSQAQRIFVQTIISNFNCLLCTKIQTIKNY